MPLLFLIWICILQALTARTRLLRWVWVGVAGALALPLLSREHGARAITTVFCRYYNHWMIGS